MGRQGRRTPPHIQKFVIDQAQNNPGLTYPEIANAVEKEFGGENAIDKTTVGNILKRGGIQRVGAKSSNDLGAAQLKEWRDRNFQSLKKAVEGCIEDLALRIRGTKFVLGEVSTVIYPQINYGFSERTDIEKICRNHQEIGSLMLAFDIAVAADNFDGSEAERLGDMIERGLMEWLTS